MKVGDPLDPETQMGAMVHAPHREKIAGDVEAAVAQGRNPGPGRESL